MEKIDHAFTSVKEFNAVDTPKEIVEALKRNNDKMNELLLTEKEVQNNVINYKEKISIFRDNLVNRMKKNARMIKYQKQADADTKSEKQRLSEKIIRLNELIKKKREDLNMLAGPIKTIYKGWEEKGLQNTVFESSLQSSSNLKKDKISTKVMLSFLEILAKKLIMFKTEEEEKKRGNLPCD